MAGNRNRSVRVTPPAETLLSVSDLKAQCRVFHDDEDDYFTLLVSVLTAFFEGPETRWRRCFIDQVWQDDFHNFSDLFLALVPVQSVDAVKYLNTDGQLITLDPADYYLAHVMAGDCVRMADGFSVPSDLADRPGAVQVVYSVGSGGVDDVPADVKHAARLLGGHWYEHRESVIITAGAKAMPVPQTLDMLMTPYRRWA